MVISTIASKYAVAITGLGLTIFVFAHMLGNLQVFLGREVINHYAHFLKTNPEILWPARIGLLVFFVAHLGLALGLNWKNRSARTSRYAYDQQYKSSNLASRSMVFSGLAIFFFLLYHLAHFTLGYTDPKAFGLKEEVAIKNIETKSINGGKVISSVTREKQHDVYSMVVHGFKNPVVTSLYVLAMVFLGMHMYHGVQSSFQSLGVSQPKWQTGLRVFGHSLTLLVVVGNIFIAVAVMIMGHFGGLPDPVQSLPK